MANLKRGWVDKGWLIWLPVVVGACVTFSNDFKVLFAGLLADSAGLFVPFANLRSNGFEFCCYSVNAGLSDNIFFWISWLF